MNSSNWTLFLLLTPDVNFILQVNKHNSDAQTFPSKHQPYNYRWDVPITTVCDLHRRALRDAGRARWWLSPPLLVLLLFLGFLHLFWGCILWVSQWWWWCILGVVACFICVWWLHLECFSPFINFRGCDTKETHYRLIKRNLIINNIIIWILIVPVAIQVVRQLAWYVWIIMPGDSPESLQT